MFDKDGPTLLELAKQALSSTRDGYDLLAPKFDKTPFRTPDVIIEKTFETLGEPVGSALDVCCGTGDIAQRLAYAGAQVAGLEDRGLPDVWTWLWTFDWTNGVKHAD